MYKKFFLTYAISEINCSIQCCLLSRRSKYKGISVPKVSSGDSDFETNWRNKLVVVTTRGRLVDAKLKDRINNERIFIYEQHFRRDQYFENELNY